VEKNYPKILKSKNTWSLKRPSSPHSKWRGYFLWERGYHTRQNGGGGLPYKKRGVYNPLYTPPITPLYDSDNNANTIIPIVVNSTFNIISVKNKTLNQVLPISLSII